MRYITRKPLVAGVYLTDHNKVAASQNGMNFWIPEGDQRFLPMLNQIEIRGNSEFRFAAATTENTDIETNNPNTSTHKYRDELMKYTKMDTSKGDFSIGGSKLILNFTTQTLAAKTRTDIPKLFFPVVNKQLECWSGKIVVLTFHAFNTPEVVRDVCGLANYFQGLLDEMRRSAEINPTKKLILDHLSQCWSTVKGNHPGVVASNTIKICLLHEYSAVDFMDGAVQHTDISCTDSGISFKFTDSPLGMGKHPKHMDDLVSNKQIVNALRDNGLACFIVDNTLQLGPRFINFAGSIREIPKVQSTNQLPGLYIVSVDSDKALDSNSFVPIDKIDEIPYIFRSQEEAQHGTDMRQQAQQQFEMDKLSMSSETLQLKHRFDEQVRKMDLEAKQRQAEYDRQQKETEQQHQQVLQALRLQLESSKSQTYADKFHFDYASMDRKNYYDAVGTSRKHVYEGEKFERDSTIETMKTIGSIAGLAAGGYVLYKQLSK